MNGAPSDPAWYRRAEFEDFARVAIAAHEVREYLEPISVADTPAQLEDATAAFDSKLSSAGEIVRSLV